MNLNEVIKRLRYKADNITAKLEPKYFEECADYLEKFRWHDLRKNPDDLPEDFTEAIIQVARDDGDWYSMNFGWYKGGFWFTRNSIDRHFKVIKWREVDMPEEEE